MSQSYFITGTDTDVGKTYCSALFLKALHRAGLTCLPFKPIAAGCEFIDGELKNADALSLIAASQCTLPYSLVNPYAFEPPIAPHIAAQLIGTTLNLDGIQASYEHLLTQQADVLLIEGAGGWHLPISLADQEHDSVLLSEWVIKQQLPIIIVVGMKLGCLNHALLTIAAIESAGGHIAGWIANQCDLDMAYYQENLHSLKQLIKAPFLTEVTHCQDDPSIFAPTIKQHLQNKSV